MRTLTIAVALALLAPVALAETGIDLRPDCGAEGDPVLITGDDFGDDPVVKFDGVEAKVIRSNDSKILCRVPDGTSTGEVDVTVDGTLADTAFTVVPEGSPVVLWMSTTKATPGMTVCLVGRRLFGGTVSFQDSEGTEVDSVKLRGHRRAACFKVPDDMDAGTYTLVITNKDELSTGDCSPELEVVAEGTPTLTSVEPDGALPGEPVKLSGSDLSPAGPCVVEWTDGDGNTLKSKGFSNGYGRVKSYVPLKATQGEEYEVVVVLRGGAETEDLVTYEVGEAGAPEITKISPDEGPAGSAFRIIGANLFVAGERPTVEMENDNGTIEAKVLFAMPGFRGKDDQIVAWVPRDAEDGAYDVTVTVGDQTSEAETFTVAEADPEVDGMKPDGQGPRGPWFPVYIFGKGFGPPKGEALKVVWDDGTDEFEGRLLFRSDRLLTVMPPGGRKNPLAKGEYSVNLVFGEEGNTTTVYAGTYTVK